MFGCIAAGRLVQATPQQVDTNRFIFELPEAGRINHLVVFLTGTVPFEEGYGAAVYLRRPLGSDADWQLLGQLSNDKPSAIFRLRDVMGVSDEQAAGANALLGLSVESLDTIQHQLASTQPPSAFPLGAYSGHGLGEGGQPTSNALTVSTGQLQTASVLAQRLLSHLYRYVTSYAKPLPQHVPGLVSLPGNQSDAQEQQQYIHIKVFEDWWRTTERRLRTDPQFLTQTNE